MQQPCYRCGAPVDDGTPFCRQCSAPQIKVIAAGPPAMEDISETHADLASVPRDLPVPARSRPIDWRTALPAIFFVAVPAGLLSFPPTILFLIWTFGAGALGVAGYRRRIQAPVTLGMAARLGLLSGVVAFTIFLIVFMIAMSRTDFGPALRQQLRAGIEHKLADNPDPNAKQVAAMLSSANGMATLLTMVAGMYAFLFILFSMLGAIAGATVFAPKNRAP